MPFKLAVVGEVGRGELSYKQAQRRYGIQGRTTVLTWCQRVDQTVPLHGGPNVTLIASLTPGGSGALLRVNGAVDGAVFTAYLDQVLGPTLRPGDVVVLNKLSVHKVDGLEQVIKKYGVRLRYLPPYSPDFNPIEWAFSNLKTWLRKVQARTRNALEEAIRTAAEWIGEHDAKNWFDHCGYHVH